MDQVSKACFGYIPIIYNRQAPGMAVINPVYRYKNLNCMEKLRNGLKQLLVCLFALSFFKLIYSGFYGD